MVPCYGINWMIDIHVRREHYADLLLTIDFYFLTGVGELEWLTEANV